MQRPCTCNRIPPPGQPYTTAYCRLCYLFATNRDYNLLWDGDGTVPLTPEELIAATGKPPGPGLMRKAWNFAQAIVQHVRAGLPITSEEEAKRRWDICQTCPLYDFVNDSCTKCGCQMRVKVTWAEQRCPENKW